jgi:hypothetical protein
MPVQQTFLLGEDQVETMEEMMRSSCLRKIQLYRRALEFFVEALNVEWPDDPKRAVLGTRNEMRSESDHRTASGNTNRGPLPNTEN